MGEIRCTVFFGWNFNHFHDILDGPKIILGLLLRWVVKLKFGLVHCSLKEIR